MTALNTLMNCIRCFAVPGQNSIIDMIREDTGLSWFENENLQQIQARYPGAEEMTYEAFKAAMVTRQDTPIIWTATTQEQFDEMLNVLPPAAMHSGGFLVGEPYDHSAATGQPRYSAFLQRAGKFYAANRPMTRTEFKAQALLPIS